jgi:hypothetical protein
VIAVIIANGVDNISVYTPLFAALDGVRIVVTVCMFLVLVAAAWGGFSVRTSGLSVHSCAWGIGWSPSSSSRWAPPS